MREKIPFSQLWIEEEERLWELSSSFSCETTIVEIGTGQGGSAFIFGTAAGTRGAKIYTHDVAPAQETFTNLKGLPVTIRAMTSAQGEALWSEGPVDVLFLDGGHSFLDVHTDFSLWRNHLRPGALVLFHDYDPVERGGVPHLGVRLFCDTMLRLGKLEDTLHDGRLLIGRVRQPDTACPEPEDFAVTWTRWGDKLRNILAAKRPGLMGGKLPTGIAEFVQKMLGASPVADRLTFAGDLLLIMDRPYTESTQVLLDTGLPTEYVDDWTLCYLVQESLESNRDLLLQMVSNRDVLFKYNELNDMMASAMGRNYSIDAVFSDAPSDMGELSAKCAYELVRLHFMEQIIRSIKKEQG